MWPQDKDHACHTAEDVRAGTGPRAREGGGEEDKETRLSVSPRPSSFGFTNEGAQVASKLRDAQRPESRRGEEHTVGPRGDATVHLRPPPPAGQAGERRRHVAAPPANTVRSPKA